MKKPIFLFLLAACLGLPLVWGWSNEEYAKIKAAGAKNADTTSDTGVLINTATKSADLAMFYHLQGNDTQADLWLAVAWQDFQQVQAPAPQASTMTLQSLAAPTPTPTPGPASAPASNQAPSTATPQN